MREVEVGVRLKLALIDSAEQPSWLPAAAETASQSLVKAVPLIAVWQCGGLGHGV
jgi:hypothetical protein